LLGIVVSGEWRVASKYGRMKIGGGIELLATLWKGVMRIEIEVSEAKFEFASISDWRDRAESLHSAHDLSMYNSIAIDALGRICSLGRDFLRAQTEGAYPVKVYRTTTACNIVAADADQRRGPGILIRNSGE